MKNKGIKLLAGGLLALTTISCVNDGFGRDDWSVPQITCNNKFEASNISLADFVKKAPQSGKMLIEEEFIIDGYVISSDENGTFYKTIVFQDKPENPTVGLQIEVNKSSSYVEFPVGAHIRINTKGLVLAMDRGLVKLGSNDPEYTVGRLSDAQLGNHMSIVCNNGLPHIAEIKPIELSNLSDIKDPKYVNQLVTVSGVQFSDEEILGVGGTKTYVNQSPKGDTSRKLADKEGNIGTLRISQYASFGAEILPKGNGKITFVVSKYNINSQILIRSKSDIDFSNERVDVATAKGGSSLTYVGKGTKEDFSLYSAGVASENLAKYINDPMIGNRYWRVAEYKGDKYLQFGYGKTGAKPYARTLFAVPVNFSEMTSFSFKTKDGYNTDKTKSVLKVYYSTDYQANATNPTLVDITSSFTISNTASDNSFARSFVNSGDWKKPAGLSGNGFIIFEYEGGGTLPTTTIQIDDIEIK